MRGVVLHSGRMSTKSPHTNLNEFSLAVQLELRSNTGGASVCAAISEEVTARKRE